MKDRFQEAVDCLAAIHAPSASILIRLARKHTLEAADKFQLSFFTRTALLLIKSCRVDAQLTGSMPPFPTQERAVHCLYMLEAKTGELLAACARYPLHEALDRPLSIASIFSLTHELCHSLGIEPR